MDNEQAKFLLQSFRPDGADAGLPEFTEALKLATEDRELGEWLANERASDASFARAINEVPIPNSLRDEILAVLAYDGGGTEIDVDLDSLFIGGLSTVTPPAGLREQILTAMEMEASTTNEPVEDEKVTDIKLWRWLSVATLAAAVAVGAFVTLGQGTTVSESQKGAIVSNDLVNPEPVIDASLVRPVAVRTAMLEMASKLVAPETLGLKTDVACTHDAQTFLKERAHPVPTKFPEGLEDAKLVGCRDMFLESGQPVSLLCFEKEGMGMVHLIAVDTKNISDADEITSMKKLTLQDCSNCSKTHFNIVHWNDGKMTYMLLTKAEKKEMVNLF